MTTIVGTVQACEPGPGGDWDEVYWDAMSWPVAGANGDSFVADGIVSDINGAMTATEVGADAFAATGDVQIAGTMSALEVGADTFAATGEAVETGVMNAVEVGIDTFASTGELGVAGSMAAQEVGNDTFAATGSTQTVVQRGGYGKDYKKPKQREFFDEVTQRKELRKLIHEAIDPVSDAPAATVLAAQAETQGVAVVTAKQTINVPVPPAFSAEQVARIVTSELQKRQVAVRAHRAQVALAVMVREEQARMARLRREDEELLLIA